MQEKFGIENLKLLIGLPIQLGNIGDSIGRDSASGWKKWLKVFNCLPEAVDILKVNWSSLKDEVKDLSDIEKAELESFISTKFDIVDDNLESTIEHSLDILVKIGGLIQESIELFKGLKNGPTL